MSATRVFVARVVGCSAFDPADDTVGRALLEELDKDKEAPESGDR